MQNKGRTKASNADEPETLSVKLEAHDAGHEARTLLIRHFVVDTMARRDECLFLENIVIQVEDVLFQVPTSIFAESEVFRGMFGLPQKSESDSNSAGNPLIMPELKAAEFRVFVRAALALLIGSVAQLSVSEWTTVLELSHKWALDALRNYAVTHCGPLFADDSAAMHLSLAQRFSIRKWMLPALERLATRLLPLDEGEIDLLGSKTAAKVWRIRDANLRAVNNFTPIDGRLKLNYIVTRFLLEEEFPDELKVIDLYEAVVDFDSDDSDRRH